jgi:hypothetical protein
MMSACLKGRTFRYYIVLPFRQYGCQMIYRRLRYRLSAVMKILPFRQALLERALHYAGDIRALLERALHCTIAQNL